MEYHVPIKSSVAYYLSNIAPGDGVSNRVYGNTDRIVSRNVLHPRRHEICCDQCSAHEQEWEGYGSGDSEDCLGTLCLQSQRERYSRPSQAEECDCENDE